MVNNLIISASLAVDHIFRHSGLSTTVLGSFAAPNGVPRGMTFDSTGNLISCDDSTNHIYHHSGVSSTLLGSFSSPDGTPNGLSVDGDQNLWSTDPTSNHLYKHSGVSDTLLGSIDVNSIDAGVIALTNLNGSLIIRGDATDFFYIVSGLSSSVIGSFAAVDTFGGGISINDENLVSIDTGTNHAYFHDGISSTLTGSTLVNASVWGVAIQTIESAGSVFTETPSDSLSLGESVSVSLVNPPGPVGPQAVEGISTKVTVEGVEVTDYQNMRVIRSQSKQGMSSRFNVVIDSPYGRHSTTFNVGEEIKIFADEDTLAVTNIFTGIVEEVKFEGKGNNQVVVLRGRDYTARLMDVTVEPIVYTTSEISTIVTNIIDNEVSDITTNNVDVTSTTLARISFNHESVFDALRELAKLSGFIFYVDEDKDLHFEEEDSSASGITFDNENLIKLNFDKTRDGMANIVWVYGDRQLHGAREILASGAMTNGSILTLGHKPFNTEVETSAFPGSILQGGILDMNVSATSGPDYLVNFHDRQIVLVSGTEIGYNTILPNGGSMVINYQKEVPIVKTGQNRASIAAYGPKEDVIVDKSIQDPQTAIDILNKALEDSDPLDKMEGTVKGWFSLTPGQTVNVNLTDFNIINKSVGILEIVYDFDKNTIQSKQVIKVRLDNKMFDVTDKIRDLFRRLEALESQDVQNTDVITRLESATGSFTVVGSVWTVSTRTDLGSSFILGKGPHGITGTTFGGILGSVIASGVNFLGDSRNALSIVISGGYNYA